MVVPARLMRPRSLKAVAIKIEAVAVKTIVVGQITEADPIIAMIRVTNLVMSRAIILATIPATTVARIMGKSQRGEVMEIIAIVIETRLRSRVQITLP